MNPLRREEHTLFAGKYYSSAATTASTKTNRTENPISLTRSNVDPCGKGRDAPEDTSFLSFHVNTLELLNDGFEVNHSYRCSDAPEEIVSPSQKSMKYRPRIPVPWKVSGSEQIKGIDKAVPGVHISPKFQPSNCPGSASKRWERVAKDEVSRPHTKGMEKQYFRRLSRRLGRQDTSKMQKKESVTQNKEIRALFEDDFIAFTCGKDNTLIHNNFMTRAVGNIARKL